MFDPLRNHRAHAGSGVIQHHASALPLPVPPGHVGPVALPGTGRMVWWTGRVAIGLRHQSERRVEPVSESALWIQDVMRGAGPSTGSVARP